MSKETISKESKDTQTVNDQGGFSSSLLSAVSDRVSFLEKMVSNAPDGDYAYCLARLHEAQTIMNLINDKIKGR